LFFFSTFAGRRPQAPAPCAELPRGQHPWARQARPAVARLERWSWQLGPASRATHPAAGLAPVAQVSWLRTPRGVAPPCGREELAAQQGAATSCPEGSGRW